VKALMVLAAMLAACGGTTTRPTDAMQWDVDQLVRSAARVTERWPGQPPLPLPEVAIVASHGRSVVPLLMPLLSDDPHTERHADRWRVQQQVGLVLARIYGGPLPCGGTYCDGDPPERVAATKAGWRRRIASEAELRSLPADQLVVRFQNEPMFSRQFQIGRAIVATGDRRAIARLEPLLTADDRHVRGNAAFVLARLGDARGFHTVVDILADRSPRGEGQGRLGVRWGLQQQIRTDRYYAAHLLGDLRDPRGVDVLLPLLRDPEVESIVPWALAEIADPRAIAPLVGELDRDDPSTRVLVIHALETLYARDALPRLRELLQDTRRSNFANLVTVGEAARHAVAVISQSP
jgi:HEAT repeat protein